MKKYASLIFIVAILFIYILLSDVIFKDYDYIPKLVASFLKLSEKTSFSLLITVIFSTLLKCLIAMIVSFIISFFLAGLSSKYQGFKQVMAFFMPIIRSFPTLAITLYLFMLFNSTLSAIIVTIIVLMPILYNSFLMKFEALNGTITPFLYANKIRKRDIYFHYYPRYFLSLFYDCIKSSFGLGLKVIIAAEIVGIPMNSLGLFIKISYDNLDFMLMFGWIMIVLLISLFIEVIVNFVSKKTIKWELKS